MLKAADARLLLNSTLPFVLRRMNPAQIAQVQRVLDAAVINPAVKKEADDIYRKSVKAQSGQIVIRDPDIVRRSDRIIEKGMIHITESDKRVRLNLDSLLEPFALKPVTDNPDEAAFLARVNSVLVSRGVWLRLDQKLVRDPSDYGHWISDPRTFRAWLSLGPDGEEIPTNDGQLTREALLATKVLAAGYFEHVHQGSVQKTLEKQIDRLRDNIETGARQHEMLRKTRLNTDHRVVIISDALGGADFPKDSIWDLPRKFVLKARELNVGGNVKISCTYLVGAAILTRNAAELIAEYIGDTSKGAERAVTVLEIADAAGDIAEIGLAVTGVPAAVRAGIRIAGKGAARKAAVDAAHKRMVQNQIIDKHMAPHPAFAADMKQVSYVEMPPGTVNRSTSGASPGVLTPKGYR